MAHSIPITLAVGTVLGFLSGLGTGGGSLLLLWLTLVLQMDPTTARNINLLFFIPSAIIASIYRWKQGSIRKDVIFPAIIWGCAAAAAAAWISQRIDTGLLQKLFGFLLIGIGIKELLYRDRKAR